jgi:hypothetical protein
MTQAERKKHLPDRTPEEWAELRKQRLAALDEIRAIQARIIADNGGKPLDIDINAEIQAAREERIDRILGDHRP